MPKSAEADFHWAVHKLNFSRIFEFDVLLQRVAIADHIHNHDMDDCSRTVPIQCSAFYSIISWMIMFVLTTLV